MKFDSYNPEHFYDEFFETSGQPRPEVKKLIDRIHSFSEGELSNRQKAAESAFMQMGITFGVYGDQTGLEKVFPFDVIPRIITSKDWDFIDRGVKQRVYALNKFIDDIYNDQKIIKDGVISKEMILSSTAYQKECIGLKPPKVFAVN